MKIKLSPRLGAIAECVNGVESMADIGTDHGFLPVYLVENKMISWAISSDTNKKPLEKSKKIIQEHHFEAFIQTRLGSGLSVLKPGEVDAIVIAGMGGVLIGDLLEADLEVAQKAGRLVLQPMNAQLVLRKYLESRGFRIIQEELAQEGERVYEIIVAETGRMKISNPLEYELGFEFMEKKHPLLKTLIDRKISLESTILFNTMGKTTPDAKKQFQESSLYIESLNKVKECL
jgi:tRNA (adenine22-N1)-methyltransferase